MTCSKMKRSGSLTKVTIYFVEYHFGRGCLTVHDRNHRRFITSHLCHKSLMSQSVDYMSQNNFVPNRPSTKQNCDKSSI